MRMLTVEQLNKLNTRRLLGVLKVARAVEQAERRAYMMQGVCCEMCMEWILGDTAFQEKVVKPTAHLTAYKNRIKKILAEREHIED